MKKPTIVEEFVDDLVEKIEGLPDQAAEERNAFIGSSAASSEAVSSQLPGRENGPADAYRHILWVAEMTRRFGPGTAKFFAERKENKDEKTNPEGSTMDRWNNGLSLRIGLTAKTWDDVVRMAQRVIEHSPGDGTDNREDQAIGAKWLDPSKWSKNPAAVDPISGKISKDPQTGRPIELPTNHPDVNWITGPDKKLDWKGKRVQEPFIYQYGGEKSRAPSLLRELGDAAGGATDAKRTAENMTMPRNEAEPAPERRTEVAFQAKDGPSETSGMLGDSMLVEPKNLSLENKDRVRARLGFHAEEAEFDPGKRAKVAKCMVDCFVDEPGFGGLSDGLDRQLGGIAATMNRNTALAVVRDVVPEARQVIPPRRRDQPRKRRADPGPLDQSGRAAVQQAVLRLGAKPVQAGIARGAAKKAIDRIGGNVMMARELPGILGAAFAPIGGNEKPLRAAAKAANDINAAAGIPDRADPAQLADRAAGRESATAIERAIQAAGPDKFMARLDEDLDFGLGSGGSRAGRSLLDA